jgi:hypothetical protein
VSAAESQGWRLEITDEAGQIIESLSRRCAPNKVAAALATNIRGVVALIQWRLAGPYIGRQFKHHVHGSPKVFTHGLDFYPFQDQSQSPPLSPW